MPGLLLRRPGANGVFRMGLPRFFAPVLTPGLVELEPQEAEHAAGARRLRAGDEVEVFDGRGGVGCGVLLEAGRRLAVEVAQVRQDPERTLRLTVAVAVPKGKRLQMMVEKLTELGVDEIRPVRFERSVAEGGDPVSKWGRWAVEAAKQCRRNRLPVIAPLQDFSDFLRGADPEALILADAGGDRAERLWSGASSGRLACLIGPEGGLSPAEFSACEDKGIRKIRFGGHVLRIETAALAFCAVAQALQEA